jgi:hypothetical protein
MLLLSNGPDQILKINLNNFVLFKDVSFVLFSQIVQVKTGLDFLHCRHRDKKKSLKEANPGRYRTLPSSYPAYLLSGTVNQILLARQEISSLYGDKSTN